MEPIAPAPVILYKSSNETISFYFENTNKKPNHTLMSTNRMAEIFRFCISNPKSLSPINHTRVLNWFKEKNIKL